MERRAEHDQSTGQKSRGKPPKAPVPGSSARDQVNLTDAQSRIMPVSGGGFEQAYNAQGAVDADTMLGLAVTVTQAPHDKQQMEPMLVLLQQHEVPVQTVVADAGDFSEKNVEACAAAGIQPLIAIRREPHHPGVLERHLELTEPLAEDTTPLERMTHTLKTEAGRALYAKRKQTVEPVFGIIKHVMGFRQFLTRGLENVRNEWRLVCLAWNCKRMAKWHPLVGN